MYQEVSKWVVNGLYWSYNLLTNLWLTSWDIQVDMFDIISELSRLPGCFIETIFDFAIVLSIQKILQLTHDNFEYPVG